MTDSGRRREGHAILAAILALLGAGIAAAPALAAFPFARPAADTSDYSDLFLSAGNAPADLSGNETWMYSATAADPGFPPDPLTFLVNSNPAELNGVRGARIVDADGSVDTAWQVTTGRPDVVIAVLDSGIKWDDTGAMNNLRFKTHLNGGELPAPRNDNPATPSEPGVDCSPAGPYDGAGDDLNGDAVFNLLDYACDNRVSPNPTNNVNPGLFEPQDLLIAFSEGGDEDSNGYVDDIVGWDFLDDDNDPYDDVQYGHGTGEAQDSTAEAVNGQNGVGVCPNCMAMHMRVGDSFIADVNRFAGAVTYATDNGALVIQEALGTMNNSRLARDAVEYSYRHGVTVIASAADEAAQHNNWPSSLPHVVMVNSVTDADSFTDVPDPLPNPFTEQPPSYLKFNGCTNFYSKVSVAIPSVSCSSDATGRGSGMAGLIYSAAQNAFERGKLSPHPDCELVSGNPCLLTANEVRQLMASGTVGGQTLPDDVDFSQDPEPSCHPVPAPTCTDPFLGRGVETTLPAPLLPVVSLIPTSKRYPARGGHDQFYGWGRANLSRSVNAVMPRPFANNTVKSRIPPEAEITSPEWFDQLDPEAGSFDLEGEVYARGDSYTCRVYVAPGHYPNNRATTDTPPGDFKPIPSAHCDGSARTGSFDGVLASVDVADLRSRFPAIAGGFDGREPGTVGQTSFGRPNVAAHGFVAKVVATRTGSPAMTGEDRRAMYLHRDRDMLDGFPRKLPFTDGESSPVFADLDGDNRNELVVASSEGFVHAYAYDPAAGEVAELPGWPVRGDVPGFVAGHDQSDAYSSGAVSTDLGGAFVAGVAVGDADHDGVPEVYAADLEGRVYGWDPDGERVFEAEANPDFSGRPLTPFVNERQGHRNRTQHGFLGSPVLADLDRDDDGRLELIAAGMDRHVYAWNDDGSDVPGFPVLAVDQSKVESVDADSHAVRFNDQAGPDLDQGGIVDTPAVGDIGGDARPEIIVGTNEEYAAGEGSEGAFNVAPSSAPSLNLLAPVGLLDFANGRAYAIKPDGDPDAPAAGQSAFVAGWPVPIGIALSELLPVVGEGIDGSPVIAPLTCSGGGGGPKVGTMPAAGPAYLLNPDGSSCFGTESGRHRTFASDVSVGGGQLDRPIIPAVGLPAFGDLGGSQPAFVAPAAGVIRALDLALNEYQAGGQDFVAAWSTSDGQLLPGWPSAVNDLQFLTGSAVGDVGGAAGEEVVAGTSSMDLVALTSSGTPTSGDWPKLTTDWTIATPLLGSLGTLDTEGGAPRVVVNLTRSGYINAYATDAGACAPASSPRFHHDNANSGDFRRDAVLPGSPFDIAVAGGAIDFRAPGDDLLCGAADAYEVATSDSPITAANFGDADPLGGAPDPAAPGQAQGYGPPAEARRYVAIRAVDEQGNVGRPASVDFRGPPPPGDSDGDGVPDDEDECPDDPGPAANDGCPLPPPPPGDCETTIKGTPSPDLLIGTPGSELIRGRAGGDRIRARAGDDCVRAGRGRDRVKAGKGDDQSRARGRGLDRVNCGAGEDTVVAGIRDRVKGNCESVTRE